MKKIMLTIALAMMVCPPKHYFCWQVKMAVDSVGLDALEARARACKWSELQIKIAKRCLGK